MAVPSFHEVLVRARAAEVIGDFETVRVAVLSYHADHQHLCLDPNARNLRHTYVTPSDDQKTWRVQQMLVDPEEHNDWVAEFEVDLNQSRALGEPLLRLRRIGSLV